MNKLRQSLRRRKPAYVPEASRPHQWQADEDAVRKGTCSFPVRVSGRGAGGDVGGARAEAVSSRVPVLGGLAEAPLCTEDRSHSQRAVEPAGAGPQGLGPSKAGSKPNTYSLVPGRYYLGSRGYLLPGVTLFCGSSQFPQGTGRLFTTHTALL